MYSGLLARADTISLFAVTGNHVYANSGLTSGPPASGTITIDVTTGQILSVDLTPPAGSVSTGLLIDSGADYTEFAESFLSSTNPDQYTDFNLAIPVASLIGYNGGFICSTAHPCYDAGSVYTDYLTGHSHQVFTDGALTPLSSTPEPGSLVLLGTGVVGLSGLLQAKRRRAFKISGS